MPLDEQEAADYNAMTKAQRIAFLKERGVSAEISIVPESLEPAFVAFVPNVARLPVGYWDTEKGAIDAGIEWLDRMEAEAEAEGVNDAIE